MLWGPFSLQNGQKLAKKCPKKKALLHTIGPNQCCLVVYFCASQTQIVIPGHCEGSSNIQML